MKVSDSMKYTVLQRSVNKISQQLNDLQVKISTQKTVNTPSDDPIKFATYISFDSELSLNSQYNTNLLQLATLTSMYDACFACITDQLDNIVNLANNFSTMDETLQQSSSELVKGVIEYLVTVANTKLGNTYVFGGEQADTAPFQLNNDYSVTYTVNATAEDATKIYVGKSETAQYGISGRTAFYSTSKIAYGSVGNTYTGDVYSNTDSFAYVVDTGSNDTINVDGVDFTLTSGVYTGSGLAKEIASQLGSGYSVGFDTTTRKFVITNNTGGDVTINWSTSNAASTLGFDNIDTVLETGETDTSDIDSGRKSFFVRIASTGSTTGATGRATYEYSIDGGSTWSAALTVSTGGADTTAGDITIDSTNNTFYINNTTAVTLTNGTYTGAALATEIQTQLGTDYGVSYDSSTRKFTIINNSTGIVTFNWSDPLSTAAGVLGFDNVDSVISSGATDVSDYDAGMFIDGSGVPNSTNNRLKLSFSTNATDALTTSDTFQIKDLSVFEMLTNLKNAVDTGDTTWVAKNIQCLEDAREVITKGSSIVAFQGAQAEALMTDYATKNAAIQTMQSDLVGADTAELGVELNVLMNTYQALLSTMSRVLQTNILDYLK
jgi:flagellin-like hook-associated protein FlgL